MRYTKDVQQKICFKIEQGYSVEECARLYNVPASVILKWTRQDISEQEIKVSALRKYQPEVSEIEARLMGKISAYMTDDLSDDDFVGISNGVSKELYNLATNIIKKERTSISAPVAVIKVETPKEEEKILDIVRNWTSNPFMKKYSQSFSQIEKLINCN